MDIAIIKGIVSEWSSVILLGINVLILIVFIILFARIRKLIHEYCQAVSEKASENNAYFKAFADRISSRLESASQRLTALNERLRKHFQQLGIKDIDNIVPSHFVKNRSRKKSGFPKKNEKDYS
jgi:cell division protein FtsB